MHVAGERILRPVQALNDVICVSAVEARSAWCKAELMVSSEGSNHLPVDSEDMVF
jgi:hypothetical protein